MNRNQVETAIRQVSKVKDKAERLYLFRDIAQDIADNFVECMAILEDHIQLALDNTSMKIKEETGYYDVPDLTTDISPLYVGSI